MERRERGDDDEAERGEREGDEECSSQPMKTTTPSPHTDSATGEREDGAGRRGKARASEPASNRLFRPAPPRRIGGVSWGGEKKRRLRRTAAAAGEGREGQRWVTTPVASLIKPQKRGKPHAKGKRRGVGGGLERVCRVSAAAVVVVMAPGERAP